jgi:hypothetical protein
VAVDVEAGYGDEERSRARAPAVERDGRDGAGFAGDDSRRRKSDEPVLGPGAGHRGHGWLEYNNASFGPLMNFRTLLHRFTSLQN